MMKLDSLRLSNFRCFGPEPQEITFAEDVTSYIGGNGAGKTAALSALARLFGITRAQRSISKSDFNLFREAEGLQDGDALFIEAIFGFPELGEDGAYPSAERGLTPPQGLSYAASAA